MNSEGIATPLTASVWCVVAACAASVSAGIPWLSNAAEDADVIGLATKAVEAVGLVFSIQLNTTMEART